MKIYIVFIAYRFGDTEVVGVYSSLNSAIEGAQYYMECEKLTFNKDTDWINKMPIWTNDIANVWIEERTLRS